MILRSYLILLLMVLTVAARSQDTLVKRNDEKILVKLLEVNPSDVKYKRFDYQDGPVFTLSKSDIKYIVYQNGVKESFENYIAPPTAPPLVKEDLRFTISGNSYYYKERRLEEQDMLAIAGKLNDKKINLMIHKTKSLYFEQNLAMYGGFGVMTIGALTYTGIIARLSSNPPPRGKAASRAATQTNRTTGEYILLGGVLCEGTAIYLKHLRIKHAHLVAEQYNKVVSIL